MVESVVEDNIADIEVSLVVVSMELVEEVDDAVEDGVEEEVVLLDVLGVGALGELIDEDVVLDVELDEELLFEQPP